MQHFHTDVDYAESLSRFMARRPAMLPDAGVNSFSRDDSMKAWIQQLICEHEYMTVREDPVGEWEIKECEKCEHRKTEWFDSVYYR